MKKIFLLLISLGALYLQAQTQFSFADFDEVMGFKRGATLSDVTKKVGKPSKNEVMGTFGFAWFDYNDNHMLMVSYDPSSGKLKSFQFYGTAYGTENGFWTWTKSKNITEPKLELMKMKPEQLTAMFGAPVSSDSETYVYENEQVSLTFYCYSSYGSVCKELMIYWY